MCAKSAFAGLLCLLMKTSQVQGWKILILSFWPLGMTWLGSHLLWRHAELHTKWWHRTIGEKVLWYRRGWHQCFSTEARNFAFHLLEWTTALTNGFLLLHEMLQEFQKQGPWTNHGVHAHHQVKNNRSCYECMHTALQWRHWSPHLYSCIKRLTQKITGAAFTAFVLFCFVVVVFFCSPSNDLKTACSGLSSSKIFLIWDAICEKVNHHSLCSPLQQKSFHFLLRQTFFLAKAAILPKYCTTIIPDFDELRYMYIIVLISVKGKFTKCIKCKENMTTISNTVFPSSSS